MTVTDIYELTPYQLAECRDYAEKKGVVFASG